ncbi:MAG: hypothetical protein Tsb002_31590 [Wenzhouxiangellaceae bacterium]
MRVITACCLLFFSSLSMASDHEQLYKEILAQDTQLFDAFNRCDVEAIASFFAKDLEFYHDKTGVSGYQSNIDSFRNNCNDNLGLNRQLIQSSLEVYPIKNFGAIQKGEHTFCHWENGKNDCGTFQFLHIWKESDDQWKLVRVVSFDH